jgi:transposase
MTLLNLSETQRQEIYQFIAAASRKQLIKRAQIILHASQSITEKEVARITEHDIRSIRKWIQRYKVWGIQGLYNKKGAGAKSKINPKQVEDILNKKPVSLKIIATCWVSTLISLAIFIIHGLKVCPKTIRNYLHKMGYTFKRAKIKSPKKLLPREVKEVFSLAQLGKCIALFLDQTCVRLLPDIRGTWIKIKEQLKITLPCQSWNISFYIFGVIDLLGGKFLWQVFDKVNQQNVIKFLKTVLTEFQGYKIYIILDQARYHTGKIIREFIRETPNLEFIFLPARCPQLNPLERIWRHIKDKLANYGFKNIAQKKQFCTQLLKSLTTEKIKSLTNGWREKYAKNNA